MKQVYDYYQAETERIKNHIKENYTSLDDVDQDELYEEFYDFYTMGFAQTQTEAKQYVVGNEDLLEEVVADGLENGDDASDIVQMMNDYMVQDAEIRCYILQECIERACDQLENEGL